MVNLHHRLEWFTSGLSATNLYSQEIIFIDYLGKDKSITDEYYASLLNCLETELQKKTSTIEPQKKYIVNLLGDTGDFKRVPSLLHERSECYNHTSCVAYVAYVSNKVHTILCPTTADGNAV